MASHTSSAPARQISIWRKLDLVPAVLEIALRSFGTALVAPFRGRDTPKDYKRHVILSIMRQAIGRMSSDQLQWLQGTTGPAYLKWTAANKITPNSVTLADQSKAFWIGNPEAETVVLYYHGGGWAVPAGEGHFNFLSRMVAAASGSSKSFAALLLQYDLAPGQQYPYQLKQSVELLRYASNHLQGKKLMLGGDSAGGNLVFGVLLHALHPHPDIEPVTLQSSLRAAFAASPWVDFDMSSARFRGGDAFDAASVKTLKDWARKYVGSSTKDQWREPAIAPDWQGLNGVVEEILVTVAKKEVMADDVQRMVANIEKSYRKLEMFAAPEDFHAEPVLGGNAGFAPCEAAKMIESWVLDRS